MSVRLFVGNLPYDVTERELREHFSIAGPLTFVSLPIDRETNKPRGFAFVEFDNPAHAADAVKRFNNQPFKGRVIAVNEARARESRPPMGGGSSGGARPYQSRPAPSIDPGMDAPPASRGEDRSRNFGPDAAPKRNRKPPNRGAKGGGAPAKGPMREIVRGQFFGDDDDASDDDLDMDNFATRAESADEEETKE